MSTLVETEVSSMATLEAPLHKALNALDRCERCGGQAYVVTQHRIVRKDATHTTEIELLWCGHHFRKHEDVLFEHLLHDERQKLANLEKPVL